MRNPVRLPRDVIVLGVIAFFVNVGFGVMSPVLPVFARTFGVSNMAVGAVISAFAVLRLGMSPWVPQVIRWFGARVTLAAGIGIVAVSSALAGLAGSYAQLLVLRGVGGIGSAMFGVSAMSLLLAAAPATLRARSAAFYQGGFLLGGMAGPAIGGAMAAISLTAPFFFYAGTLVLAGAVGLGFLRGGGVVLPDGGADVGPGGGGGAVGSAAVGVETNAAGSAAVPFHVAWRDVRYRAACLSNLGSGWASVGVRGTLVPLIITEVLGLAPRWTGIVFAIAAVAQTLAMAPAGSIVDTRGRRGPMVGAGLAAAALLVVMPHMANLWWLALVLAGYAVTSAFLGTAPAAVVGDVTGAQSARAVAAFSMFSDAGSIAGPLAAGALADAFGYPVAFAAGAALLAACSLYAARMPAGMARG